MGFEPRAVRRPGTDRGIRELERASLKRASFEVLASGRKPGIDGWRHWGFATVTVTNTELFLLAMLAIVLVPWLAWRVGGTDNWAPLVVVQILVGILLGPGVLGVAAPALHGTLFRPEVVAALNGIAWWAVAMFVWTAGLELNLGESWAKKRDTGVTAGLALAGPLLLGSIVAAGLVASGGWSGPRAQGWQAVLGIGMACAVTALPILILLMEKLDILRRPLGQRVLRYASLDDVAIWGVLAFILLDWTRLGRQAAFLLIFALTAWGARLLLARAPEADRWHLGLIWLLLCALGADWAGLHFMVGAFLAGAVLEAQWFGEEALDAFRRFLLLTVMPVFFLSTGLRTSWEMGGPAVLGGAALLLAASVAGKLGGVALAGRILGWRRGEASVIGWLLQTKALISIIFANILLDRGLISGAAFTALLLMAVGSTVLTVPVVAPRLKRLGPL